MAQDESRSISENVTWSVRKRVQEGKVSLAYSTFLGYDKGDDGKLKVNEEQAETIKIIFRLYMIGYSAYHIKEKLEELKIKTPFGKTKWHVTTIQNILCNEKYKGDALLQKTYTVDFLTKKTKKNEGELPQVYVENAHDAIIDKKAFDLVQIETERRKGIKHYSGISIFSNKVVCGECGAFFGRKVWHSNDKYRMEVYRCNEKYNGKTCDSGHITEDEIKKIFVDSYNKLPKRKTIEDAEFIKNKLQPTDKELKEREKLVKAVDDTYKKSEELIKLNTIQKQDQKKYNEEYNALVEESKKLNEKLTALENKIKDKESRMSLLADYINTLKSSSRSLTEFDEGLFAALLDKMIVRESLIREFFAKLVLQKRTIRIPDRSTEGALNKDKVQVVWRDGSTMEVLK